MRFHETIKNIEADLRQRRPENAGIELHASLISETHSSQLVSQWKDAAGQAVTRELMESWNILFREQDDGHVKKLVETVASSNH